MWTGACGSSFSGFFRFGVLPVVAAQQVTWSNVLRETFGSGSQDQTLDVVLLAVFAAIAGAGGMSNVSFSNYLRDKG